jgi:hypothetical protein
VPFRSGCAPVDMDSCLLCGMGSADPRV